VALNTVRYAALDYAIIRDNLPAMSGIRSQEPKVEEAVVRTPKDLVWPSLCWFAGVIVLYVLSIGPVLRITENMNISNPHPAAQFFTHLYKPIEWAYANTFLHKPIGVYYHLWVPDTIDKDGNVKHN